jgi:TRAF-interacting protein
MPEPTDPCPICHDTIETTAHGVLAAYKLPECGHTFHTECAVNWFRHSPRCPMCNDTGVSHDPTFTPYFKVKSEYASASAMSRKKTAKPELKRQYEKISNLNTTIKTLTAQKTQMMGETGVYRDMRRRFTAVNRKLWRSRRLLYCEKKTLVHMCPHPVNVIIPRRVMVGDVGSNHAHTTTTSSPPPNDEGEENSAEGYEEESHV